MTFKHHFKYQCAKSHRIISLFLLIGLVVSINGNDKIPKSLGDCFFKEGDIYIGYLINKNAAAQPGECSRSLYMPPRFHIFMEAFARTIDEINSREDILPNITLGYIAYDACFDAMTTLGQALKLVPSANGHRNISCAIGFNPEPVVAVVGYLTSRQAVMASSVLSLFEIPIIVVTASSDELSDKSRFDYFLRLVPPDRFQAKAIIDILLHFNWTYASLLFSSGSYGETGARNVELEAKAMGICIPMSTRIPTNPTSKDFENIFISLFQNSKAKVVILFSSRTTAWSFFKYATDQGFKNEFIFIGGDAMAEEDFGPSANGMLTLDFAFGEEPNIMNELLSLSPGNSQLRPWMQQYWEAMYDCPFENFLNTGPCSKYQNVTMVEQDISSAFTKPIDATFALAHGIHDLLKNECTLALENKVILSDCLRGPSLLEYTKGVSFPGKSSYISFNEQGALVGQYIIRQYISNRKENKEVTIGVWDQGRNEIIVDESLLDWTSFHSPNESDQSSLPSSICSTPCKDKEYAVQMELPCCWECRSCRSTEYLKANNTGCQQCPTNYWPDEETTTFCVKIEPQYMRWADSIVISLTALTLISLIISIICLSLYVKNRDSKLIKASCRELNAIILIGINVALCSIFFFLTVPSNTICIVRLLLFNLSVSFIYVPLFVKTNRVYRIFSAGQKGVKTTYYISTRSQIVFSLLLISIQVRPV